MRFNFKHIRILVVGLFSLCFFCFVVSCESEQILDDFFPPLDFQNIHFTVLDDGFVFVGASGKYTYLGTNDVSAKFNERPQMKVLFDYDFIISQSEITCGEFKNVAFSSGMLLELNCLSDSLPASDVNYYDVVLFCNALSKMKVLDTAYTYDNAIFDESNHCIGLTNLNFLPSSNGIRLPTEAEWTLVANQGWNTHYSWNSNNSDYKKHNYCSMPPNSLELCDVSGNVMEWVNDYLGGFKDTVLVDYVGKKNNDGIGERVVKGGSYRTDPLAMNIYNRGDVYAVTSLTRADYLGFRVVSSSIPNATYMDLKNNLSDTSVKASINSKNLLSSLSTSIAKLAFVNEISGNLFYVNFTANGTQIYEFEDSLKVYHPDISPDGKNVAFCTGLEGVRGESSIYVRSLTPNSILHKLNVKSAGIPRFRILENGDTVIVYVTNAGNNKDESTFKSYSTWEVPFMNDTFGVPKKILDGAFHGGIDLNNNFAVTGSSLFRNYHNKKDTIWYNGEQVCNVSLAKDGSNRSLFLDFASETGISFAKEKYKVHERIFIVDSLGNLIKSIKSPLGYAFDHAEWLLSPSKEDFLVATLSDINGNHKKIVLVDIKNDVITDLMEGTDLWHPSLWTNDKLNLQDDDYLSLDSACVYFNQNAGETEIFFRYKLELLWNYYDISNVVALGSSRMLNGFNPMLLNESLYAINLSNIPNTMYVSKYLFENYVIPHVKNLSFLLISLDIDLWYKNDTSDNFFYKDYKNYPGYVYDENHNFWKDKVPMGLKEASLLSPGVEHYKKVLTSERGFYSESTGNWGKSDLVNYDSTWLDFQKKEFDNAFEHLKTIIQLAKNNNVYVIGIIFPQSPNYKKTGSFGRYGLRRSEAPRIIDLIDSLGLIYDNFILLDENKMGNHDYPSEMGMNSDHLNKMGAKKLSYRLDSLMVSFKNRLYK